MRVQSLGAGVVASEVADGDGGLLAATGVVTALGRSVAGVAVRIVSTGNAFCSIHSVAWLAALAATLTMSAMSEPWPMRFRSRRGRKALWQRHWSTVGRFGGCRPHSA